jgi:hypothetical protein
MLSQGKNSKRKSWTDGLIDSVVDTTAGPPNYKKIQPTGRTGIRPAAVWTPPIAYPFLII